MFIKEPRALAVAGRRPARRVGTRQPPKDGPEDRAEEAADGAEALGRVVFLVGVLEAALHRAEIQLRAHALERDGRDALDLVPGRLDAPLEHEAPLAPLDDGRERRLEVREVLDAVGVRRPEARGLVDDVDPAERRRPELARALPHLVAQDVEAGAVATLSSAQRGHRRRRRGLLLGLGLLVWLAIVSAHGAGVRRGRAYCVCREPAESERRSRAQDCFFLLREKSL